MAVLEHDIVVVFLARQAEFTFAVSHPNAELTATKRAHQDALIGLNGQSDEARLELVAVVMEHLCFRMVNKSQFHHQLAAVADT